MHDLKALFLLIYLHPFKIKQHKDVVTITMNNIIHKYEFYSKLLKCQASKKIMYFGINFDHLT